MAQVCALCHADRTFLMDREMHNSVASYVRSFHGKAALLGDENTADCLLIEDLEQAMATEAPLSTTDVDAGV
mgnify:CR=1 FL=1